MLDIKLFRENPKIIKDSEKRRRKDTSTVDDVIKIDSEWREIIQKVEKQKTKKNKIQSEISQLSRLKKDVGSKIAEMKRATKDISDLDQKAEALLKQRDALRKTIGNILDKDVPDGTSDEDNVVVRSVGKKIKFKFNPLDHIEIGKKLDLFDTDKAAELSGSRFYFLRNEMVKLNLAVIQYAMDTLIKEGYTPIMPPNLIHSKVLEGAGYFPGGEEDAYKIEGEDLYLIGTSEQVLCALHMNETLEESELPKYYAGFSPCYRTEAGSHGRDTKGIFRIHQFEKVEQVKICLPEQAHQEHLKLVKVAEKLFGGLGIPYRVVDNCTGDIGYNACSRKFDLEVWLPGQNKYREAVSASNCTDYQARRLNTKVHRKNGITEFAYTLNSTAIATERCLIAILENFQQKDGSVKIPKALWKYTGFKVIKPK